VRGPLALPPGTSNDGIARKPARQAALREKVPAVQQAAATRTASLVRKRYSLAAASEETALAVALIARPQTLATCVSHAEEEARYHHLEDMMIKKCVWIRRNTVPVDFGLLLLAISPCATAM